MRDKKREKKPVTSSHTIKCFGIEQSPERVLTRILLSLRMRILHALWATDIRCPFMRSSPDSHALALHPLAAQGPHQVKHSTEIWLKLEWKDTRAVWYGSGGAVSSDAISQTERYQKYQVCLCSRGLFHGIRNRHYLSAAFSMKRERGNLKHVSVKPPSGSAIQHEKHYGVQAFKQKIPQSDVFFFPPTTLILPSILTSLCLSVIHAHPHLSPSLSRGPFIPSSVTRLSWGVQAGAGLAGREVSERWPLPAVFLPHVCLMTPLSIYKANGFLRVAICLLCG